MKSNPKKKSKGVVEVLDYPKIRFGIPLYRVTAAHMALIAQIKNPFAQALQLGMASSIAQEKEKADCLARAEALQISPENLFEILFVFSKTPAQIRAVKCAAMGENETLESRLKRLSDELADRLPPVFPDDLTKVLSAHFFQSFADGYEMQKSNSKAGSLV